MRTIKVDEFLVVNIYSGKRRWLQALPRRLSAYEVAIRIKGSVKIPDAMPIVDFGEISVPDMEAAVQAGMG